MTTAKIQHIDSILFKDDRNPNWLLWILIFISIGMHLILFIFLGQNLQHKAVSRIELTLQQITNPQQREIPRPKPLGLTDLERHWTHSVQALKPLPLPNEIPEHTAQQPLTPNKLAPHHLRPQIPAVDDANIATWEADPEAPAVEASSNESDTVELSLESYIQSVRKRIDVAKTYPLRAQRRKKQGVAEVEFTIAQDGHITQLRLLKSTNDRDLDRAAINAVKKASPFDILPKSESLTLKIPIQFIIEQ